MKKSLRQKLIVTTMATLVSAVLLALTTVAFLENKTARANLDAVEVHITNALNAKGSILATNHALAMRGFGEHNAFMDIMSLVETTVREDEDIVYGLFLGVDEEGVVGFSTFVDPESLAGKDLDSDRWKQLGIVLGAGGPGEGKRTVEAYGQGVWEFSAAVVSEGEQLGSIRYGLTTEPMHKALSQARDDSFSSVVNAMAVLAFLGFVVGALGFGVIRKQAGRITRPLAVLSDAANAIASGQKNVQVSIDSGDELEVLGESFNTMVGDLEKAQGELEGLNKNLEHKVEERTRELAQRSRDIEVMLQNLEQGIFTVLPGQVIHHEYSANLEKILRTDDIAGQKLFDVLFQDVHLGSDALDAMDVSLGNCLGTGSINFMLNSHLLVTEFVRTFRDGTVVILEANWTAISNEQDETEKIMVTLRDVTEIRAS